MEQRYPPPLPRAYLGPRYWPLWLGFGLLWLLGHLPRRLRHLLGEGVGRLALRRNAKRRAIVETNLEWCFPEWDAARREQTLWRFAGQLGRSYLEFGFFWWCSREAFLRRVDFEGEEEIERLMAAGEQVVLVTPHSLAMDIGGMALSLRLPLVTFANDMRNPLLAWMVARQRGRFGCQIIPRSRGIRPAVKSLKSGRVLYFPSDEDQGERDAETVFAPFFGIAKSTLTSPWRLARIGGARVLACNTYFDVARRRYVVRITPPLAADGDSGQAAALNAAFEGLIRLAPEQMLWSLRLFQTRPDGSPPPYTMKGKPGSGPRPRPE